MKMPRFARVFAAAIALTCLAGCGNKSRTLFIYTWSDYISPDVVAKFEAAHNCKVDITTFDSNEAMYAKLKSGAEGYDVIMPTSYLVPLMAKEGLILGLDHARIPNVRKNFDKDFASQILDPEFKYSVPYAITYTGFMYSKKAVPAGADVTSWDILANPALKGKVTLLDDIREVIGAGLMACGYSINSRKQSEIDAAVAKILTWKENARKFDAESYKTEVASGATLLGHAYSTDATQIIVGEDEGSARPDIGFALPRQGYTIAVDEMVISSKSVNTDLAYAFIDFMYDGANAKDNMDYIMGPMPVKPGIDALDAEYRSQIVLSPEVIKQGQRLEPVDDDPAVMDMYNKAWDRIKATK